MRGTRFAGIASILSPDSSGVDTLSVVHGADSGGRPLAHLRFSIKL